MMTVSIALRSIPAAAMLVSNWPTAPFDFSYIAAPTPVAPNVTDFTLIVAVKSLPWYLSFLNPLYYSFLARQLFTGATDDYFPIWKEMDGSYRGVLVEEDRLQQRFRKYYRAHLPAGDANVRSSEE